MEQISVQLCKPANNSQSLVKWPTNFGFWRAKAWPGLSLSLPFFLFLTYQTGVLTRKTWSLSSHMTTLQPKVICRLGYEIERFGKNGEFFLGCPRPLPAPSTWVFSCLLHNRHITSCCALDSSLHASRVKTAEEKSWLLCILSVRLGC